MKLYTSRAVAKWLGLSERRIRQLRDDGIIEERAPGLYELHQATLHYIKYLRDGTGGSLNEERAKLTKAKREAAELENSVRRGELLETKDVEFAIKEMLLNLRAKLLALPGSLSPEIAKQSRDQAEVFDIIKDGIEEALEALSEYKEATKPKLKEEKKGETRKDAETNA